LLSWLLWLERRLAPSLRDKWPQRRLNDWTR
jgi:hypothetical protein